MGLQVTVAVIVSAFEYSLSFELHVTSTAITATQTSDSDGKCGIMYFTYSILSIIHINEVPYV